MREPLEVKALRVSIFLLTYSKYPLNADIWSYSAAFKNRKRIAEHKNTKNAFKDIDYGMQFFDTFK